MDTEKIDELLDCATIENLIEIVKILLSTHFMPVFGAAEVIEHEISAILALKKLRYLSDNADKYEYVEKLRITKAKARSLMYQEALRQNQDIDNELRKILTNPRIQKDSKGIYLIEVPYPLVMDKLRQRVRKLGYISDGTFNGSIAKIPEDALIALIEDLLDDRVKVKIIETLKNEGILIDASVKSLFKSILKKIGNKLADDVGEEIAENIGEGIKYIFNGKIIEKIKILFEENSDD